MQNETIAEVRENSLGLARAALGLIYPTLCFGCEIRLPEDAVDGPPICTTCLRRLPRATSEQVARQLARLPEKAGGFTSLFALWVFDDGGTIQRLQHALKYQNRPQLGVRLGRFLARELSRELDRPVYDAIIPVPLARRRELERGYNQSRQIALGVSDALVGKPDVPEELLVRTRATKSQTNLSSAKRWANVSGAFALRELANLSHQHILLVDDVLTTGATLTAAARPLLDAGATVDLAVFAVVAV